MLFCFDTSIDQWFQGFEHMESKGSDQEFSVDALLLLQKSLLEKQWHLSTEETLTENNPTEKSSKKIYVSGSEKSARRRRIDAQRKSPTRRYSTNEVGVKKPVKFVISPELLQTRVRGYAKGIASDTLFAENFTSELQMKQIEWQIARREASLEAMCVLSSIVATDKSNILTSMLNLGITDL
ncbi:hypothetical protein Tco_0887486 [Tanacetum coccineum]